MKKVLINLAAAVALITAANLSLAQTTDAQAPANPADDATRVTEVEASDKTPSVFGFAKKGTRASAEVTSYCSGRGGRPVVEGKALIISGVKTCTIGSIKYDFFQVEIGMKTYFVPKDDIELKPGQAAIVEGMPDNEKKAFATMARGVAVRVRKHELDKVIATLGRHKNNGLTIVSWGIYDESEYTKGTGFKVEVYNPTKKTIKYVTFSVTGYNAVNDVVRSYGQASVTRRGIGPIAPDETGSYRYDYTWRTNLVEDAKITSVKVDYMDGSSKVISNPKLIMLSDAEANAMVSDE